MIGIEDCTRGHDVEDPGIALGAVAISGGLAVAAANRASVTSGYDFAFAVLAVILLVSLVPAPRLAPSAGGALTGRR